MTGIELIAEERQRQIDLYGYSDEHIQSQPSNYGNGELADAASCYALDPNLRVNEGGYESPVNFPWADSYWKPGERLRDLAKAGAMIVAEMDRLLLKK